MKLFCSGPLQKKLCVRYEKCPVPTDPLDGWYAHLIPVRPRSYVVVMLLHFRFVIILPYGDWTHWSQLEKQILQRIREALRSYEIPQAVVDEYLPADTVFEKCCAEDPETRAKLSSVVKQVRGVLTYKPDAQDLQNDVNETYYTAVTGKKEYGVPCRELKRALLHRYGVPTPAMELEFALDLERYVARRTLIVPVDTSFLALHDYLQTAYHWQRKRIHKFVLPPAAHRDSTVLISSNPFGGTPDPVRSSQDAPSEVKHYEESNTRLQDLLQVGDTFQYFYDIGDTWEIQGKVVRTTPDYPDGMPVCTFLEGKAPPEVVGGVSGFLSFLAADSIPNHPKYQTNHNSLGTWTQNWTIEEVNQRLRDTSYRIR